jgi:hypothetical protein
MDLEFEIDIDKKKFNHIKLKKITLEKFNLDKIKLTREELKIKYYGYGNKNSYKINKEFLILLEEDDIDLFKKIYNFLGDPSPNLNLFDIACRFNSFYCVKFLVDKKYPKININTALGLVGLYSLNIDFTQNDLLSSLNLNEFKINNKTYNIKEEKYINLSEWLIFNFIDNITDFNNLFIIFVLTNKVHLLKIFSKMFSINNKIAKEFFQKIDNIETIKWFIDKVREKESISEENCDIILSKFNLELWDYLYNLQEYDHKFHKLFPIIAEKSKTIDFAKFICDKLDINDTLFLNVYNIRNCYNYDINVLNYMQERGVKFNIIRPNFSIKKLSKLYVEKYFTKEDNWKYTQLYPYTEDNDPYIKREDDNINIKREDDPYSKIDNDIEDDDQYMKRDREDFKWKNNNFEIGLSIEQNDNPFVFFYYIYYDRMVIKKLTTLAMWQGNEEKFLLRWYKEVDNYNQCINNITNKIYENAGIK